MPRNTQQQPHLSWLSADDDERRIQATIYLPRLTVADGLWLARVLPALQRKSHAQAGAVCIQDVGLRHRSGRLGIADAMDAAAELLSPFATAGADVERRSEWYIYDEDEEDDEDDEDERPARLSDEPDHDLLVSARMVVDAAADDAGSAALHWVALALTS
jgi:hypothetical protein